MSDLNGSAHPIAVYYEHPDWFNKLFDELDRRGVEYEKIEAHNHRFDPMETESPYSLIVNRMSPSAWARGHTHAIPYTLEYCAHLQAIGANVINGYEAYLHEFSKVRQTRLLKNLGVNHPKSRVINHPSQAPSAAEGFSFPIITKANIGGSGAGIQKYDTPQELQKAADEASIDFGIDNVALVQEYIPPRGEQIIRVEVLNGEFLYAIQLALVDPNSFNLCPGSYCRRNEEIACGVNGRNALVEKITPPQQVINTVEKIMRKAGIEVGGVEYLVNDKDGEIYYYDINALSNFVDDAQNVIGFDPWPLMADFVLERAQHPASVLRV